MFLLSSESESSESFWSREWIISEKSWKILTNKNNQLNFTRNTLVLPVNNQALSIIIKESILENKSKKINNIYFKAKNISAKQLNNLQDVHTSIYRKSIIERINITTQHILLRNLNINKLIENTQNEIDSICIK